MVQTNLLIYSCLFILIVTIISFFNQTNNIVEGYNERLTESTFEKCADFCKTTAGCYAFGYDKLNNVCYPSQENILGRPLNPSIIYKDEYNKDNSTCNKLEPVLEPGDGVPFDQRRPNSIFVCSDSFNKVPQYYLHNRGTFENIGEGKNPDEIFDIDDYAVNSYKWPTNKYNIEQTDLLYKDILEQTYNEETITSIPNLKGYGDEFVVQDKISTIPFQTEIKTVPKGYRLDYGIADFEDNFKNVLVKVKDNVVLPNYIKRMITPFTKPFEPFQSTGSEASESVESKLEPEANSTNYTVFREYDDSNEGEYLNSYRCVDGISRHNCLSYCANKPSCTGVEWNPLFGQHANICCPMRTIKKFIPRPTEHRYGKFYQKEIKKDLNPSKIYTYK